MFFRRIKLSKVSRRPNPNDFRSVALLVGSDVVNDSRPISPPPAYPTILISLGR